MEEIKESIQRRIADKTSIAYACLEYANKTGSSAALVALLRLREVVDSLPNKVNRPDACNHESASPIWATKCDNCGELIED